MRRSESEYQITLLFRGEDDEKLGIDDVLLRSFLCTESVLRKSVTTVNSLYEYYFGNYSFSSIHNTTLREFVILMAVDDCHYTRRFFSNIKNKN